MTMLVRQDGTAAVYLADGVTRRWVRTPEELDGVRYLAKIGALPLWNAGKANDGDIYVAGKTPGALDPFGILVGPDPDNPAGTPATVGLSDADRIAIVADLATELGGATARLEAKVDELLAAVRAAVQAEAAALTPSPTPNP